MDESTVAYKLGSIESKIDAFLESQKDHETRIKSLENSRAKLWGGTAVLVILIEFVKTFIPKWW